MAYRHPLPKKRRHNDTPVVMLLLVHQRIVVVAAGAACAVPADVRDAVTVLVRHDNRAPQAPQRTAARVYRVRTHRLDFRAGDMPRVDAAVRVSPVVQLPRLNRDVGDPDGHPGIQRTPVCKFKSEPGPMSETNELAYINLVCIYIHPRIY